MEGKEYIKIAKEEILLSLKKDELIIFLTRIIEDIENKRDDFYGRIKELFLVLDPYGKLDKRNIYSNIKKGSFSFEYGLKLEDFEKRMLSNIFLGLKENFNFKDHNTTKGLAIKGLRTLEEKYLPNSCNIIEHFILGKLISFFGGIENLYRKPASTIQLIGAEKALFRHKSSGVNGPKYGLIYRSKYIQDKNKGKLARKLANQLAIKLKEDYFQNFAR